MANQINISAMPGLIVKIQLYNGVNTIGSLLSTQQVSNTGEYVTSMPVGIPFGSYLVLAIDENNLKLGSGIIHWDGNYELPIGPAILQGLNPANPSVTTPTTWNAGDIAIDITGDGITSTTITRQ